MDLPAIAEQTAIAEVLSSLDDKIDLLHRQNKTLESLAETLFRQWFIEEADDSWESSTLSQHTEVFRGLSYRGSGLSEAGKGLPMHNLRSSKSMVPAVIEVWNRIKAAFSSRPMATC